MSKRTVLKYSPKERWKINIHVENERRQAHGGYLGETAAQSADTESTSILITAAAASESDFRKESHLKRCKPITFARKIQTPKCWREKPLFSLTVASSRRNPSRALRKEDPRFRHAEKNREALKQPFHLAQQPPWNV